MTGIGDMGFYGVLTNPLVGYEELARVMVSRGLKIIQLRMKGASEEEVVSTARRLREIIPDGVTFIVNDHPEIAARVGADGVHLGQDDMPFDEARRIVGPDAVIGLSTHNPRQTVDACAVGPDYIGVGPVWATPTKKNPDPAIGIDGMRAMLDLATVPAVVLGGIDHSNVAEVIAGGARNVCAVRCINASKDPGAELDRMIAALGEKKKG